MDSVGDRYEVKLKGMGLLGAMGVVCVGEGGDDV